MTVDSFGVSSDSNRIIEYVCIWIGIQKVFNFYFYVDMLNLNSCSGTNNRDWYFIDTPTPCLVVCTVCLQFFSSVTHAFSSAHVSVAGASLRMSPSALVSYMSCTAFIRRRSGSMRRICPSHCSLLARIALTMSKERVPAVASSFCVRPVTILTILLLAPLMTLCTSGVRFQDSDP